MTLSPGARLGPYEITAKLGEGGMGEVWRATDTKLGREVALKVLPATVAADPERLERFRREARAVAALNHPNIVTLHSIDEVEGISFLTMELVEGESLDRLVAPHGMPIDRVVQIGLALSDALAAAHGKKIVHRDLKPGNVMVDRNGRVKILDFGVAKVADPEGGWSGPHAATWLKTREGMIVGTLPYMAPEQLRGERPDARSDLFSLGILLFELTTGERPFRGATAAELSGAILRDPVPRLAERRADAPAALERVLRRCLEKDPQDRFETAGALHDELTRLRHEGVAAPAGDLAIAVLPFSDMSPARDQEALCEGMAEEIMNALVGIRGLRVAARASAFRVKREGHDPGEIARLLHVGMILDGSIRTAGKRLRATAQLVDTGSGFQVWSERYDREAEDLFAVQDEIADAVAAAVRARLRTEAAPVRPRDHFASVEAYQAYLRGRHLRYTKNDHSGALRCYEEAIAIDPACAPAWVGLAETEWLMCFYSMKPVREAMATGARALATATRLVGETPDASYIAGLEAFYERRWPDSERWFRRAVELDPHRVEFRFWLGTLYILHDRMDEAAPHFEWGRAIDPLASYPYAMSGLAELLAGRPEPARRFAEQGLGFVPGNALALWVLGLALAAQGRAVEAVAAVEGAVNESNQGGFVHGVLGWACALAGRRDAALEVLKVIEGRPEGAPAVVSEAWIRAELGDLDGAWAALGRAEAEGQFMLLFARLPGFDRFRGDPRFRALVGRLRLPD